MEDNSAAVNDQVVADTTPTESAPVENTSSEVIEDEFDGLGDVDLANPSYEEETEEAETKAESSAEEAEESTDDESESQSQGEEKLSPKSENRFQKLANTNRELLEEIERLKSQEAQVANEQELLNEVNPETGDYYTPQEVQRIAFQKSREAQQQSIAQQRQALEVQQARQELGGEATKALSDFPMFDADSKDYNPTLAAQADQILGANLVTDAQGQIVGSRISPYQLYKTIADANREGQTRGQASAQRATEKMLANADRSSDAPTKGSGDPMSDLEDRIGNIRFVS